MDKLKQLLKYIWQDKWLILLSLALAFVSWQRIHRTIGYETTLSQIPIELIAPEGWSLLSSSLDDVSITLRGSQEEIRLLNKDNLRVIIPLPEPNAQNEATIRFSNTHLLNPSNARLIRFNPPQINVSFDQTAETLIPVKSHLHWQPSRRVRDCASHLQARRRSGARSKNNRFARAHRNEADYTRPSIG